MITLTISKPSKQMFEVDDNSIPGSPPVGRGRTMKEAIGDWFHNNQSRVDVKYVLHSSAEEAEKRRRRRELAKR